MHVASNNVRAGVSGWQSFNAPRIPKGFIVLLTIAALALKMVFQLSYFVRCALYCLLLLCGDIHTNPGPRDNRSLKFFHWNLNSLSARGRIKIPLIETYDSLYKYDIITISGTMLDDFAKNRLRIGKHWFSCRDMHGKEFVRLKQRVSLAARSETIASVKCNRSLALVAADFEPISLHSIPGAYATKCRIIPDMEGVFQITFLNVNDSPIDMYARKCVGNLVSSRIASLYQELSTLKAQINCEKNLSHGEHLTTDQQFRLEMLIKEYSDIFASNPKKPALVKNAEHRIITGDALPVKRKPHRIPEAWHKEVNTQIQEMLDTKILRPSPSPWNAPIILVKKRTTVCALCV